MQAAYALLGLILGIAVDEAPRRRLHAKDIPAQPDGQRPSANPASGGRSIDQRPPRAFAAQDFYDR